MSGLTIAVLVGIVWPAVALVVAWRVGRRLQGAGDRYPVASGDVVDGIELVPAWVCPGCAECSS